MPEDNNTFWIGQNIWVVLGGGGIYLVPEHPVYGSLCILAGVIGFAYSLKGHRAMSHKSTVLWVLALLLTWGGIGYDYYDRHHNEAFQDIPAAEVKMRQSFKNKEVPLDGIAYVECTFENVTFVYNAKRPYQLIGNRFQGTNNLRSDSKGVVATIGLLKGLGLTNPNANIDTPGTTPIKP
ncbi:MAG TPA: hypothetical protein VGQ49_18510 [Bryobacteraceae bacterium]|jgi:hypothetical protein|nr:hypothetical protein [Bryobacteraceae bacterium]